MTNTNPLASSESMNQSNHPTRRRFIGTSIGVVATNAASAGVSAHEPPTKRSFQRTLTINIPFAGLRRLAVDVEQNMLAAAGNEVLKYSPTGKLLDQFSFDRPVRCLATAGDRIIVGIRDHVRILDAAGRLETRLPTIGEGHVVGEVIEHTESVLVFDITSGTLKRFSKDGRWRVLASAKGGFQMPAGGRLTRHSFGAFAATNPGRHRIELLNERGQRVASWGKRSRDVSGFQGCCNPLAAISLADGTTITAEAGQVRLKQFDESGNFIQQISGPDVFPLPAVVADPTAGLACSVGGIDLAASADDTIWVLHATAKQIIQMRA